MPSDDEIVARIRAGDEEAFDTVVREHYDGLCAFAARMLDSDAAAEEVVQDVLLRVWEQRERWEVATTVAAYLYGSVRNRTITQVRRERVFTRWQQRAALQGAAADDRERGDEAYHNLRASELAELVSRAIEELPPRCREVFVLRRVHHLSGIEVARVMGIAPKTVEIQMGIALRTLRRKLAPVL